MYVSVLFVQVYVVISLFMVWLAQCNVCRVQFVQVYQSVGGLVCSVQCQRAVLLKALPRCAAARTPAREDAGRAELGAAPPPPRTTPPSTPTSCSPGSSASSSNWGRLRCSPPQPPRSLSSESHPR